MSKTIAYVGTRGAGSFSSLVWIREHYSVQGGESNSLAWAEIPRAGVGTVRLQAATPGTRFDNRTLSGADAIVYVVDTRAGQSIDVKIGWNPYFREMLELAKLELGLDDQPDPPVILQYTHRDAPDARPIEEVECDLGVRRWVVSGGLRAPNPFALRYPKRFEACPPKGSGLIETFQAALDAALDGPFPIAEGSADFAMAMLDKQLGEAIGSRLGQDPELARRAVRGSDPAREEWLASATDRLVESVVDAAAERLLAKAAVAVVAPETLRCCGCGQGALLIEAPCIVRPAGSKPPRIGDPVSVDLGHDAYWMLHEPARGEPITVLDIAACSCGQSMWCSLTVHDGELASIFAAEPASALERAHAVRASALRAEAARIGPVRAESLSRERAIAIVRSK